MTPDRPLTEESLALAVGELVERDADLRGIVQRFGPPPLWNRPQGFATLAHIVLEQQVSLASARAAFDRLQEAAGELTPARFLELDDARLLAIGFSRQKAGYVRNLARAVETGAIALAGLAALPEGHRAVVGLDLPDGSPSPAGRLAGDRHRAGRGRRKGEGPAGSARPSPAGCAGPGVAALAVGRGPPLVARLPQPPPAYGFVIADGIGEADGDGTVAPARVHSKGCHVAPASHVARRRGQLGRRWKMGLAMLKVYSQ